MGAICQRVERDDSGRGILVHTKIWSGRGCMSAPATGPNMVSDVHNGVFPTAGEL